MAKSYRHLTYEQRCQIYILKERGDSFAEIARIIGVHRSTVTRELERNSEALSYHYEQAHQKAQDRRKRPQARKLTTDMIVVIKEKLRLGWSSNSR